MLPKAYFSDLQKHPPLSRNEEEGLTARLKTRPSADDRDRLITSNLRYVVAIAMRYRNCGLPLEDLINEGNIGLIEAVSRYNPDRGTRFLTYATWWIRKAILGALTRQGLIRIPPSRMKKVQRARQEEAELIRSLESRNVQKNEEELQSALDKLDSVLGTVPKELSLDDVWGFKGERAIDDLMPSLSAINPEQGLIGNEQSTTVRGALAGLSRLERSIIQSRFGMDEKAPKTLREIGKDLGISRERVRQIEMRSREKIRVAVVRRSTPRKRGPYSLVKTPRLSGLVTH